MIPGATRGARAASLVSLPVGGMPAFGIVLFLALALLWSVTGLSRGVEHLSSDQFLNLVLVLKGDDPSLFSKDLVFDGPDLTREYIPLYIHFLRAAHRWWGDPAAGYKLMIFPLTLCYLTGAYFVFHRFAGVASFAVGLALFSSVPYRIPLATDLFGLGPIGSMLARAFFTAAMPWTFLAFSAWLERPVRLVLLFLGIGLLSNLHPVSGFFLAAIFILILLLEHHGGRRAWVTAGATGLATLTGASSIIAGQLPVFRRQTGVSATLGADVADVLRDRLVYFIYPPHTMSTLPRGLVDALTLIMAVVSLALLVRWRRPGRPWARLPFRLVAVGAVGYILFPAAKLLTALLVLLGLLPRAEPVGREERLATLFALGIFWSGIGGLLALRAFVHGYEPPVLFVIMNRGMRFALFAAYLLLAVFLRSADWSRVARSARIACVGLAIATVFWQLRSTVREATLRPRDAAELADLAAAAKWARVETDPQAIFLFDSPAFRVLARRSLAFTMKDVDAVASHRPDRSAAWVERRAALRRAGSDPAALWETGVRYRAGYVVVPTKRMQGTGLESRIRYQNSTYTVLATGQACLSGRLGTRGGAS